MLKKCKVVMLPTNEKAEGLGAANWYFSNSKKLIINNYVSNLYIISDEEIKEGDWIYVKNDNRIVKCDLIVDNYCGFENGTLLGDNDPCYKVIATTDKLLKIIIPRHNDFDSEWGLPSPSQSFIEKYISEYNKGNVITDLLVEYVEYVDNGREEWIGDSHSGQPVWFEKLEPKISKDNTITIKRVKDSWSREEVIAFTKRLVDLQLTTRAEKYKWIEENL